MDVEEEIGELGQVLTRTTATLRETQDWLQVLAARAQPVLALPRATLDLSFGLQVETGRRALLVRRRRSQQILTHRLRFGLVATPEPPSPPSAEYRRELLHPAFLMTDEDQASWRARLAEALASAERRWRFPPEEAREERKSFQKKVAREGEQVARSERMIFFRLPEDRVLAVRVAPGRSGRQDGLFVFEPGQPRFPWAIYNFEDDGAGRTHYRPLALLVRSLGQWRAAGEPRMRSAASSFDAGISSLDTFQEALEEGLTRALEGLSRPRSEESPAGYLDFDGIEALVSFSLAEGRGIDLSRAASETDPERDDLPASVVRIRVEPAAEPPRVTTELAELEFLLAGADRRAAVELIVRAASEKPLQDHRRLIEDPEAQDRAVLLRAFHERTERLLVIWPAGVPGSDEDLVFTCPRRWLRQRGEYEIGRVTIVKGPADPAALVTLTNDLGAGAQFQYRPFHRFFRAVLAWQRRGDEPE